MQVRGASFLEVQKGNQGTPLSHGHGSQPMPSHFAADEHPCATYFDVHQGFPGFSTFNMSFLSLWEAPLGIGNLGSVSHSKKHRKRAPFDDQGKVLFVRPVLGFEFLQWGSEFSLILLLWWWSSLSPLGLIYVYIQ